MSATGFEQSQYAEHSFRSRDVTAEAQAGLEDATIRAFGRWISSAFMLYIWTPREWLASRMLNLAIIIIMCNLKY